MSSSGHGELLDTFTPLRLLGSLFLPRLGAEQGIGHVKVLQGDAGAVEDGDFIVEAAPGRVPRDQVTDGRYREGAGLDSRASVLEVADLK
jgi:hypothetical protein